VVLVSLDTLRADRIGAYGNADGLTPNLDRFATEAVLFEHAYSQATTTAPSHASLFTSRYPSEQEAQDRRKPQIGTEMPTLAEALGAYGWDSAGFVAGGDLAPAMGIGRGFATWDSAADFASLWHTTPLAFAWLDARPAGDTPWLLFVHGYDAHVPYLKPTPFGFAHADVRYEGAGQEAAASSTERILDGWMHPDLAGILTIADEEVRPRGAAARARLLATAQAGRQPPRPVTAADIAYVQGIYDGGVAYADTQFGLLMAGLQDRGLLDRAIVVALSDHGEQLGEDGVFNHCCGVGDEESHVPLLVRLPEGAGGGRRVAGLVELVDVMPTLLDLAGVTPPAGIHGHSLVPALLGEPFAGRPVAYTQGGLSMRMLGARTLAGRLIYSGAPVTSSLTPEFIDTAALPGPSFLASDSLDLAAQGAVRTEMAGWLRGLAPAPEEQSAPLPEALRTALRDHGYFDVKQ
jgi:arylsulfatase